MIMNDDFYNSEKWRKKSKRILSLNNYVDQVQRRYGKYIQADLIHHALPLEDFPQYAYNDYNLIPVSYNTHRSLHNPDGTLTAPGIEVARRAARKIGIDITEYINTNKKAPHRRTDYGRYGL